MPVVVTVWLLVGLVGLLSHWVRAAVVWILVALAGLGWALAMTWPAIWTPHPDPGRAVWAGLFAFLVYWGSSFAGLILFPFLIGRFSYMVLHGWITGSWD